MLFAWLSTFGMLVVGGFSDDGLRREPRVEPEKLHSAVLLLSSRMAWLRTSFFRSRVECILNLLQVLLYWAFCSQHMAEHTLAMRKGHAGFLVPKTEALLRLEIVSFSNQFTL